MSSDDYMQSVTIGHFVHALKAMSSEKKQALTSRLVEKWSLTQAQQDKLKLLEIPQDDLLLIHSMLKLCYPYDSELQLNWIKAPNREFKGRTAIDIIMLEGVDGVKQIISYLSRAM